ncbi:MAG TPA: hypothetical protein VF982_10825 [Anaerolineales bacterium]
MNSQTRREIRSGLSALALSGLLFALGIVLRGPVSLADPGSCCRAAVSAGYVPGWTIILVATLLHLYGFFGLYRYLTYQAEHLVALLAMVLEIVGIALLTALTVFFAVSAPVIAELYQQGNKEAMAVVEANFTGTLGLTLLGVSTAGGLVGTILFTVAIWRDGRLPKWTAVLLGLSILLLALPLTFPTELLGAVLLLVSAGVMAWKGWQESAANNEGGSAD